MKTSTQILYFAGSVIVGHYLGFEAWASYMLIAVLYIAFKQSGD